MNDYSLRKRVKMLKATDSIKNYYELAELLGITEKSFYNWLSGYYNLGHYKSSLLKDIVDELYVSK